MIRITLNLARQPGENLRRARIVWGGALTVLSALLVLLGIIALVGWRGSRPIQAQTDALGAQIAPLAAEQGRAGAALASSSARIGLDRAAFFNRLIDRKAVSWTQLFERLEQIAPPGIEMVSLRPLIRNGANAVDIRFASETMPPAIEFVTRLENADGFADAQVEHETEASAPAAGVRAAANAAPRFQIEVSALYQGLKDDSLKDAGRKDASLRQGAQP
ncbi:MAG TPA: hypothetical protein VIC54_05855 [Terriglobales bacterium]|jgi:hypothetical protein